MLWRSYNAEELGYGEVILQRSEAMDKLECRKVMLWRSYIAEK